MIWRELDGPFGEVSSTMFLDGKVQLHDVRVFDAKGHLAESWMYDGNRAITGHEVYRWTADGQRTELAIYGNGDVLVSRLTWDPETDINRYKCFDSSGALLEDWIVQNPKVLSFWEASDEPNNCGHVMFEDDNPDRHTTYVCHKSKGCEVSHSYSTYAGPGKTNIRHTDFRDSAGKLKWASDYEYQFDSHSNWTHRTIRLTIPGDSGPFLYAEDTRSITYWEQ